MLRWKKICIASSSSASPPSATRAEEALHEDNDAGVCPADHGDEDATNSTKVIEPSRSCPGISAAPTFPVVQSLKLVDDSRHEVSDVSTTSASSVTSLADSVCSSEEMKRMTAETSETCKNPNTMFSPSGRRLLASTEDETHLNPLHCFVRRNTEIFLAQQTDMDAPAPGRKKKILSHQIGLRCIHCLHLPTLDRVKRAVCYPSSVNRIYHCVSDMKFDHFAQCTEMPPELKEQFARLKTTCCKKRKRSHKATSHCENSVRSTAQYYLDSARKIGIVEGVGGIFLDEAYKKEWLNKHTPHCKPETTCTSRASYCASPSVVSIASSSSMRIVLPDRSDKGFHTNDDANISQPTLSPEKRRRKEINETVADVTKSGKNAAQNCEANNLLQLKPNVQNTDQKPTLQSNLELAKSCKKTLLHHINYAASNAKVSSQSVNNTQHFCRQSPPQQGNYPEALPLWMMPPPSMPQAMESNANNPTHCTRKQTQPVHNPRLLLAVQQDEKVLNALHCFVRKNIEVFAATSQDVAVPAPGRRTRIVLGQVGLRCIHCSTMPFKDRVKRAVCYPPTVQGIYHCVSNMKFDHFETCRGIPQDVKARLLELKLSCNRKGGLQSANCTAHYYAESAEKLGLVDTTAGIRFRFDSSKNTLFPEDGGEGLLEENKDGEKNIHAAPTLQSRSFQKTEENGNHVFPSLEKRFDKPLPPHDGISVLMYAAESQMERNKESDSHPGASTKEISVVEATDNSPTVSAPVPSYIACPRMILPSPPPQRVGCVPILPAMKRILCD